MAARKALSLPGNRTLDMTILPNSNQAAETYTFTARLPIPPGVNHAYRTRRGQAGVYDSPEQKAWKCHAGLIFARWPRLPAGEWALRVEYRIDCTLRRDIDNSLKSVLDEACRALGINDNRIYELHGRKRRVKADDESFFLRVIAERGHDWNA